MNWFVSERIRKGSNAVRLGGKADVISGKGTSAPYHRSDYYVGVGEGEKAKTKRQSIACCKEIMLDMKLSNRIVAKLNEGTCSSSS